MKEIKDILQGRRSIRRYTRDRLTDEQLMFIYEAIRNTPTSYNGQQFSVVAIRDQQTKERLYEITGMKQIKTSALFMVFCLDYHKIKVAASAKGIAVPDYGATIDGYTVGVVDASLAMMNASVAAEALGLGSCCIGYARTSNPTLISEILGLPQDVAIVCGLSIGVPNEMPDRKPKQPLEIVVHEECYMDDDRLASLLTKYDEQISSYNRERAGAQTTNDWATHIICDFYEEEVQRSIAEYLKQRLGMGR